MADLVYKNVMQDLKRRINDNQFPDKRLPDERSLSDEYQVSRSSVKRALNVLAQQGIIFKKRGSGTFVNPLYLKNQAVFSYEGRNLGVTDSMRVDGKHPGIKLLDFQVVPATTELQQDLFLNDDDFVYQIKRLRLLDDEPVMIETGFIPIKIMPELSSTVASSSIFNYLEDIKHVSVTKSFMTVAAEPSTREDQHLLSLKATEPVGVLGGIFFLDDGTPFEVSNMRIHYQFMKYNTFVDLDAD